MADETTDEKVEEAKSEEKHETIELTREDVEWIKKQRSQPAKGIEDSPTPTIQKVEVMTVSDETIEAPLTETEVKKAKTSESEKLKPKTKRQAKRLW